MALVVTEVAAAVETAVVAAGKHFDLVKMFFASSLGRSGSLLTLHSSLAAIIPRPKTKTALTKVGAVFVYISTRDKGIWADRAHNGAVKYGALVGWGVVIYAVVTLAGSTLALYGFSGTLAALFVQLLVLIITATVAGRSLRLHQWIDILPYSLFWALIAILFDAMYNTPFFGWATYAEWKLWVAYGLVVTVPLLAPFTRMNRQSEVREY